MHTTGERVHTNGVELDVTSAGTGPLVVLVHGFPELGYSWRHQIGPLADAGYRVVVPDMRGYGHSSRPDRVEDYDIAHLTGDLAGLLDHEGVDDAVFVGHDWGAIVSWQMALLHPERVRGVVGCSVPFTPRPPVPPLDILRARFAGKFFYIVYFQEPGTADAELGADPHRTMRRVLCGVPPADPSAADADDGRGFVDRMGEPTAPPGWLTEADVARYGDAFAHSGFTGPLNWYRNFDRNWSLTAHVDGAHVTVPSFFIGGTADPVLALRPVDSQEAFLDDHRGNVLIDGAGHWIQQERPDEVTAALLRFLADLDR